MELIRSDKVTEYLSGKDLLYLWSLIRLSESPKVPGLPVVPRQQLIDFITQRVSQINGEPVYLSHIAFNYLVRELCMSARSENLPVSIPTPSGNRYIRADNGTLERVTATIVRELTKNRGYAVVCIWIGTQVATQVLKVETRPQERIDLIELEYIRRQSRLWNQRHQDRMRTINA